MSAWDGLNRRKFPRANYPCLLIIREVNALPDAILTHTENIGIGGICVLIKRNLKIYTQVELEIDLLDLSDHIYCRGQVVWSVRRKEHDSNKPLFYDIGIEFAELSPEDAGRLSRLVEFAIQKDSESLAP